ncbi:MAG: acyltransferase [Pseudomonadota bacterium]|nr:acyltransferase [Pseudomonadota bacterium]
MRRLQCLDGLRGVLAAYVLVSHMAGFAALPAWATQPFSHGEAAVDTFFILSGMVILRSLESFHCRSVPFIAARAARTLPAFLAVFAVALVLQPLPTALPSMPWIGPESPARAIWSEGWPATWRIEIAAHLTMTHGIFPDGALPHVWVSFLGAAWSLSTEWQFYALAALLVRLPGTGQATLERTAWLLLAVSITAILWAHVAPAGWHFSRAFLPNKAQYFALGIASAGLTRALSRSGLRRFGLVLAATLALCVAQGGAAKLGAPLLWTACLAAQLWPRTRALGLLARGLQAPLLLRLGSVSYSLYLVNEPVQNSWRRRWRHSPGATRLSSRRFGCRALR